MQGSLSLAFNTWMDDFVNHPEQFESVAGTALKHLRERMDGRAPTYGESCEATLIAYLEQQQASKAA